MNFPGSLKRISFVFSIAGFLILLSQILLQCDAKRDNYGDWEVYGGNKSANHYSSLNMIDTDNVAKLHIAWQYHTGDADTVKYSQMQCNPIVIDGLMYVTSPTLKLIALDPSSGIQKWVFDPDQRNKNREFYQFFLNNNRGVTYWGDNTEKRILYCAGSGLYAIDAKSGKKIISFGNNGVVDLHEGLGRDVKDLDVVATSPGIIYKDLLILGSRVDEGPVAAPGHIRAFNVRTGKLEWIFHTIPQPGEYGYNTWDRPDAWKHIGGCNSWGGFSLDEQRGILFAPTGSASFNFYGGNRTGDDLFANSLLAINAATGKRIWHFQFVHHDLWDMDVPAAPVLISLNRGGKNIDAVVQTTKQGMIYVFDRVNGKPIYDIDEVKVDRITDMPGERISPTQPYPRKPAPFVRQQFGENDINPYLPPESIAKLKTDLKSYRYGEMYIPPGRHTSVVFPGYDGGGEWGGPSYDPETNYLYVNANEMAWLLTMTDVKPKPKNETFLDAGKRLYIANCLVCHGPNREGAGNNPSIANIKGNYNRESFLQLLVSGRRMMPSFKNKAEIERQAIASFILDIKKDQNKHFKAPPEVIDTFCQIKYTTTGYFKFLSPEGYPAISPPWGTLNAIDISTGEYKWKIPLGEYPEMTEMGIPLTGTENYGGSAVTAGGLLFIAATKDGKLRAFNKYNGKLLWEYKLPAPGFATPTIYAVNGKQYLVIACGGGKLGTKAGDSYVAFSL